MRVLMLGLFVLVQGCVGSGSAVRDPREAIYDSYVDQSRSRSSLLGSNSPGQAEKGAYEGAYGDVCSDDIFSQFLRQEYHIQESPKADRWSAKQLRDIVLKVGPKAQFYARKILTGPSLPYFGGLPVVPTPGVEMWVHYYKTRGREDFIKWMVRGETFRDLVATGLRQEGLPQELFYLAMIESGFSNTASSRARATGTWQFMKPTAKHYGLKINQWIDERRDPVKSTIAAARYLRDLYVEFGDWYLAMAAYNAGPGKVRRAIRESQSQDYWVLANTPFLRQETKQYVPKMLAALIINASPEVHGFLVPLNQMVKVELTTVTIKKPTQLSELSDKIGMSISELKRWNPEILRNVTPPGPGNVTQYKLRLPVAYAERFFLLEEEPVSAIDSKIMTGHERPIHIADQDTSHSPLFSP